MALIINVSNNFQLIEDVQKINIHKGFLFSVEFNYLNSYYLLDVTKGFNLWFYNEKTKLLEYKEIIPKSINNENIINNKDKINRVLNYIESKSLFIIQNINLIDSIEFYTIDKENSKFNLILINKIIFKNEEFKISRYCNNYCIVKDKYLLIGSNGNINHSVGGIYIINLDTFKYKYCKIDKCCIIYSLLYIRNNIIICTSDILLSNYTTKKYGKNNKKINKKRNINDKINYNIIKDNFKNNKENINDKKINDKNNIINNIKCNNLTKNNNVKGNYKVNIITHNINNIHNNLNNNSNCNIINNIDNCKNNNNIQDINKNSNIITDNNHIIIKNNNDNLINDKNIGFSESIGNNKNNHNNNIRHKTYKHKLVLLELIENENENEKTTLNNKLELYGDYYNIYCNKVILDYFILSSFRENNSVIKINEDLHVFKFCNLNNPFDE